MRFEDAIRTFEGFTFDAHDDRFDCGEERTLSIGMAGNIAVLVVVRRDRDDVCRIISARQATRSERK
ncbi:MAG: BrnT family toxin [Pseudomonadota bacterium]